MAEQITNMEKYENYREQMGRLKKAIEAKFFLEAIFIEYAVMEDRLTSILIHAGHWTSPPDEHVTIQKKLHLVDKLRENKNNICGLNLIDDEGDKNKIDDYKFKEISWGKPYGKEVW